MLKNTKCWSLKNKNNKKQKDQIGTSNGYPVISPSVMNIGDVVKGTDGNEYTVKCIKGEKQYVIHQKVYKWSKSGVLYKTLDNTTITDNEGCSTPRRMSKSRTKQQHNN
jgi:hypothetical protein